MSSLGPPLGLLAASDWNESVCNAPDTTNATYFRDITDPPNPATPLDLRESEQVVYELAGWSFDMQAEAAEVLAESQIPHAWDGTDLVVHLDWEPRGHELLDAVERGATGGVDASDDELVYELDEWPEHDREALMLKMDKA